MTKQAPVVLHLEDFDDDALVPAAQFALYLGIDMKTLRHWVYDAKVPASEPKTTPRGRSFWRVGVVRDVLHKGNKGAKPHKPS